MTSNPSAGVVPRLSIMMFLQFFVWGAWFATLSAAMDANGLGDFIGGAYDSAPIAAVFAPLFLGLIADRLFPSERVMGLLMLIGLLVLLPMNLYAAIVAVSSLVLVVIYPLMKRVTYWP
ncbi:MAG: hypothetical protein ACO3FE_07345, partial [Planctomycetaceae bacterium]